MATYNELPDLIEPSDVFGAEPSTDAGYARETFTLTLVSGDVVNTGRILVLDYVEKTATLGTPTTATATVATNGADTKLGVFYGADLKTNGTGTRTNHEVDFAKDGATVQVVVVTHGDGSGQVSEGYLHLGNATVPASFYQNQTLATRKALRAKLITENRFKVLKSTKPQLAIV